MWIMSTDGFVSMVRHNKIPDTMLVRARVKADLEKTFPGYDIETHIGADYLYRALVPVDVAAAVIAEQVKNLDYTSHAKDEMIKRAPKADVGSRSTALYATWNAFAQLQPYAPYAKTPRPAPFARPVSSGQLFSTHPVSTGTGSRSGGYDWSSHPQSTSYVGPETVTDDDCSDIPDEAFALSDADWADFLARREVERLGDAPKPKSKSKRSRGHRRHKK